MKYFIYSLITLMFYVSTATIHAAGIQKWTDANGRVHYGDKPPKSANVETIRTSKRPTVLGKPLPRLNITSKNSVKPSKKASSAPASSLEPEQAQEACKSAKNDFLVIKKNSRIQLRAADGSLRYMTKEEIKQRLDSSKENIDKFCQ